jgi:hypothetical protein
VRRGRASARSPVTEPKGKKLSVGLRTRAWTRCHDLRDLLLSAQQHRSAEGSHSVASLREMMAFLFLSNASHRPVRASPDPTDCSWPSSQTGVAPLFLRWRQGRTNTNTNNSSSSGLLHSGLPPLGPIGLAHSGLDAMCAKSEASMSSEFLLLLPSHSSVFQRSFGDISPGRLV